MVSPVNITAKHQRIQQSIASDDIESAIKLSMDFARDFSSDNESLHEIIVISNSYNRLNKDERRGILEYDKADNKRVNLLFKMLDLLDSITQEFAQNLTD
jgi:hypothetical protein